MTLALEEVAVAAAERWDTTPDPRRLLHQQDPELFDAIEAERQRRTMANAVSAIGTPRARIGTMSSTAVGARQWRRRSDDGAPDTSARKRRSAMTTDRVMASSRTCPTST